MQSYPRGLEIFGHCFVTVVSRVIAEEMNPLFCRIGVFEFSEKTHCRLGIEHFILLNEDFVIDDIDHTGKIKPGPPAISGYLFPFTFFDPSIGRLHIVRGMHSIHEADRFILGQILLQLFVSRQPLSLLLLIGLTGHKCGLLVRKTMSLQPIMHARN